MVWEDAQTEMIDQYNTITNEFGSPPLSFCLLGIGRFSDPVKTQWVVDNLNMFKEKGWLKADDEAKYYIYAQTMDGRTQYGIVGAAAQQNKNIRHIDIKALQKELVSIGSLPENVLSDTDNYPPSPEKIREAVRSVVEDLEGLELILWDQERGIEAVKTAFHTTQNEDHRLTYARILGMLGVEDGWEVLINAIESYDDWDEGWNFTGMGQFGRSISYLDSLIIAAGRTKKSEALPAIFRLMEKLTPESHFSHFRATALALESINDQSAAEPLYRLLQMKGVRGHTMPDIHTAKRLEPRFKNDVSTRNNSLRELILGRALFKCGDYSGEGQKILGEYSKDLRGHYYRHASGVLESTTFLQKKDKD